ncbi:exodeoxyribonuclease VII [Neisseria meningitidis]|nr:exodeoxyribonuclease VII [Neisseria meningitidis]MBG8813643.1 exodeoxyribonuclease VII [Neisseria meningitidis]MBG8824152.1 exodeoxyribonuclease VII [Neisseria meningitidis]MBG8825326.1 exodeoxyribonuclease VII [Neisseria meningitidis]MBG8839061.1 exodeoxyribonuclease VII [Neisseria meningitidis]
MPSEKILFRRHFADRLRIGISMFQHTGRHIKRRPMCCPDSEGVTPLPNKV